MEILLLVVVLAVGGTIAYLQWRGTSQRREQLFLLATTNGLTYARRDVSGILGLPFAFFRQGDRRGVENVISGHLAGERVRVFDFFTVDVSTDAQGHRQERTRRYTCAVTELTGVWWPAVSIAPETMMSRLEDKVGLADIQFESDDFNRRFDVRSKDRRFAFAMIDPRMMSWLLSVGDKFQFEVSGRWILLVSDPADPAGFLTLHHGALTFRSRIPSVAAELYPDDLDADLGQDDAGGWGGTGRPSRGG